MKYLWFWKKVVYIKGSILHRVDFHASILMIWDLIYKNSNLCETLGELVSFCFSSLKEMGIYGSYGNASVVMTAWPGV